MPTQEHAVASLCRQGFGPLEMGKRGFRLSFIQSDSSENEFADALAGRSQRLAPKQLFGERPTLAVAAESLKDLYF
jgi:hypothetical protein